MVRAYRKLLVEVDLVRVGFGLGEGLVHPVAALRLRVGGSGRQGGHEEAEKGGEMHGGR